MRNVFLIMKRELQAYLASPMAYIVTAVFLAVVGGIEGVVLYYSQEASMYYVFGDIVTVLFLVLTTQLMSMRLVSEEKRSGTLELLMTTPVPDWQIILGKYLASLVMLLAMLVLNLGFPLVLTKLGNPDLSVLASGYLGFFLLGAALLAIGLFASSITRNQIVAAIVGLGIVLVLWMAGGVSDVFGDTFGSVVVYLGPFDHYIDFVTGIISSKHLVYYFSVIIFFLFASTRVVESRRWK